MRPLSSFSALLREYAPYLLYCAIGAAMAVRFHEAYVHNPMSHMWSDPARHWNFGTQTLHAEPWLVVDPPLFQMWLSLVQKITLGLPEMVAVYAGALSSFTPWLWYRFLHESVRRRGLALLGWALLAWLPSWIGIYSYFMTETLFLALLGASLWQTMRARRQRTVGSLAGMVVLWTLAGLTRGIAAPLAAVCGLWVWLRHPKKVRSAVCAVVILAGMLVPFAYRNHDFLGLWSPLGTGWPNQIYAESGNRDVHMNVQRDESHWRYEFLSPSQVQKPLEPVSDWAPSRVGVVEFSVDLRHGNADWAAAYQATAAHGMRRLRLRWENMILVLFGQSWPDNNPEYPMHVVVQTMRWIWAPLLLAVTLCAVLYRRIVWQRPLVPMLIATWFVFQAVSLLAVNEGRYRKPLEGLLVAEILILLDLALMPGGSGEPAPQPANVTRSSGPTSRPDSKGPRPRTRTPRS